MKKIILSLCLILISTTSIFAQSNTAPTENRFEKRQEIRDQRKAKLAEKVNNQLAQINEKTTAAFERHLTNIQNLLNRVKSREKAGGAQMSIDATQIAIDAAKVANEAQKQKTYLIEFAEESGLKVGASQAKTNLRTDLTAIREKVKTARQKLIETIKEVKAL